MLYHRSGAQQRQSRCAWGRCLARDFTHGVEDIEIVRQGITAGCDGSIVRDEDGVVQRGEVRQREGGTLNVRHLGCCALREARALGVQSSAMRMRLRKERPTDKKGQDLGGKDGKIYAKKTPRRRSSGSVDGRQLGNMAFKLEDETGRPVG